MQRRIVVIVVALIAWGTCSGQDPYAELRAELLEMGRIDQDVRLRIMARLDESDAAFFSSDEFRTLAEEQASVDEENFLRLEQIIQEYGWPSAHLVGEEANGAAWVIMQHADIERHRRYLPVLREAVEENRALASNLAMLEDEIALADNGALLSVSHRWRIISRKQRPRLEDRSIVATWSRSDSRDG